MGLIIHSLGELPTEAKRGYYVYLLDYGWDEPISNGLSRNFAHMAKLASQNDAVVIRGSAGAHFEDEVLSWHHVNGQPGEEILPAILITTRNPHSFRHFDLSHSERDEFRQNSLLLIPLRHVCKTSTDVVNLITKIFRDIKEKKSLMDFEVAKEISRNEKGALVDSLILKPNLSGIGIDLKKMIEFFGKQEKEK